MRTPRTFSVLVGVVSTLASAQVLTVDSTNSPYTVRTATTYSQVTVAAGATLVANAPITVTGSMQVSGRVTIDPKVYTLRLDVGGTLTVDFGGALDVDGLGLLGAPAAGYGASGATLDPTSLMVVSSTAGNEAGGAHASLGGMGGVHTYGSALEPTTPGGGGGVWGTDLGGAGGGVIRVTAQSLVLNGQARANGANGNHFGDWQSKAGGGAGGSVNLRVTDFSGSGQVQANGGFPVNGVGYGGAGRIKVASTTSTFVGSFAARNGSGTYDGTVQLLNTALNSLRVEGGQRVLVSGEAYSALSLGPSGTVTISGRPKILTPLVIPSGSSVTLTRPEALEAVTIAEVAGTLQVSAAVAQDAGVLVRGRLIVDAPLTVADLDTTLGAVITHSPTVNSMHLVVPGTVNLVAGAQVNAIGMGYPGGPGAFGNFGSTIDPVTSAVIAGSASGTGGSHGGRGAQTATASSAPTYDSPTAPRFGGGGGGWGFCPNVGGMAGGAGGGVIRMTAGVLRLQGNINADGAASTFGACNPPSGSGAGGSVVLTVDQLVGDGGIYARGGSGNVACLGGGGGLINITSGDSTNYVGPVSAGVGTACVPAGEPGIVITTQRPAAPRIVAVSPQRLLTGDTLTTTMTASGATPITWSLTSGPVDAQLNASSGRLTWASSMVGTQTFSVTATNAFGSDQLMFTVDVVSKPLIVSTPNTTAQLGLSWRYDDDGQASATGTGPITWLASLAPPGFAVDSASGLVSWTPNGLGTFAVCLQATNPYGTSQQCFSVEVRRGSVDGGASAAPVFRSHPSTSATCGAQWHYSGMHAPEVDGTGPFLFSVSSLEGVSLPTGLSIDAQTGELSWTPSREQKGITPLVLRVDSPSGSAEQSFAVVVECPDPTQAQVSCSSAPTADGALVAVLVLLLRRHRRSRLGV